MHECRKGDDQSGPAEEGDIGPGEDFSILQRAVRADQEDAAEDIEKGRGDEPAGDDEDLPGEFVLIPDNGLVDPKLVDGPGINEGEVERRKQQDGEGKPFDAPLSWIVHIVVYFSVGMPKDKDNASFTKNIK